MRLAQKGSARTTLSWKPGNVSATAAGTLRTPGIQAFLTCSTISLTTSALLCASCAGTRIHERRRLGVGLGIGSVTTIFTLVEAVLIHSLPYDDTDASSTFGLPIRYSDRP